MDHGHRDREPIQSYGIGPWLGKKKQSNGNTVNHP